MKQVLLQKKKMYLLYLEFLDWDKIFKTALKKSALLISLRSWTAFPLVLQLDKELLATFISGAPFG